MCLLFNSYSAEWEERWEVQHLKSGARLTFCSVPLYMPRRHWCMAVLKALLENITYASLDQNDEFLERMGARWRRSLWIRIWKHSGQVIFIGSWNQVDMVSHIVSGPAAHPPDPWREVQHLKSGARLTFCSVSPLHAKKALMYGSAQGIARKHHLCIVGSKWWVPGKDGSQVET